MSTPRLVLTEVADSVSAAAMDIARLRADLWAVLEAMKKRAPDIHEHYDSLRLTEDYLAIPNGASFHAAKISAAPKALP